MELDSLNTRCRSNVEELKDSSSVIGFHFIYIYDFIILECENHNFYEIISYRILI